MAQQFFPTSTRNAFAVACFLGVVIYIALSAILSDFRGHYSQNGDDITVLVDALLLVPNANWLDWFTKGYKEFFDPYPDWPGHERESAYSAQARPFFHAIIYFFHFVFGKNWADYQLISYAAVAGVDIVTHPKLCPRVSNK